MFSPTRRTYDMSRKKNLPVEKKKVNKISYGSLNLMCNETFLQFHAAWLSSTHIHSFVDQQSPVAFLKDCFSASPREL